jgi:ubiquinone/menaquinone biosynthesis C-methylase UbiE
MGLKNKMCGYEIEHMSNISFRLMSFVLMIRDIFFPVGKKLDQFSFEEGYTVIDFGCGPGSFIEHASKLVGNSGKVYAVDIQPLAIKAIREKAKTKGIANVFPILSAGYPVDIESQLADIIYALDMFHHIKDTQGFLKELHRLIKPNGKLFIESGHQKMVNARQKLVNSGFWVITKEKRNFFECLPRTNCITSK